MNEKIPLSGKDIPHPLHYIPNPKSIFLSTLTHPIHSLSFHHHKYFFMSVVSCQQKRELDRDRERNFKRCSSVSCLGALIPLNKERPKKTSNTNTQFKSEQIMTCGDEGVVWRRRGGTDMDMEMKTHNNLNPILDDTTADMKTTVVVQTRRTTTKLPPPPPMKKKRTETKRKKHNLVSYRDSPDYLKDNEYILDYYRADWPLKEALFSIFSWHNETLNVWTHLLGFLIFLGLTIVNSRGVPQVADFLSKFNRHSPMTSTANDSSDSKIFLPGTLHDLENLTVVRWPFFVFLGGSMFCLLSSSICHLFLCHSQRLHLLLLRIDYMGIAVMIITSFFPPIYYSFQCDSQWQFVYLTGITVMGIFTVVTLFSPALTTGPFRPLRAILFSSMVLFGIFPVSHSLVVNWNEPRHSTALVYELAMVLSYGIGTLFYVSRIPERLKPGMFDIAGHSHQLFHVFVIMGALAHYGAALLFIQWRNIVGCDKNM